MSLLQSPDTLKLLQNLLKPPDESSGSEDDDPQPRSQHRLGPGDLAPKAKYKPVRQEDSDDCKETTPLLNKDTAVEEWLNKQEQEDNDVLDSRKQPEYKILYKQSVGTEDLFLQMGNKNASTASCEDMTIEIEMPEEKIGVQNMDLSLIETELDLKTPIYRLKLPLMYKVDPNLCTAKFNSETKVLTLTLRMKREFDFVNF